MAKSDQHPHRGRDSNSFQCATCLNLMGIDARIDLAPKEDGKVRRVWLSKDCDCPPQK